MTTAYNKYISTATPLYSAVGFSSINGYINDFSLKLDKSTGFGFEIETTISSNLMNSIEYTMLGSNFRK